MAWANIKAFCKDNSNTIFSVLAIMFTVGTAVSTVVETAKACKDLENAEYEKWEDMGAPEEPDVNISLTAGETIKLVWPRYIVPGIMLAGAVTFEICALRSGQKKIDAALGAYVMAAQTVGALKDSIRSNLPPRDVHRIESGVVHNRIAQDRMDTRIQHGHGS